MNIALISRFVCMNCLWVNKLFMYCGGGLRGLVVNFSLERFDVSLVCDLIHSVG